MLSRVALVWRTLMAHYRLHPAQGIFLLTGLSLGVAILLGTLIVSYAAKTSFAKAQQTVNSTIVGNIIPANGRQTLPQSLYVNLRRSGFTHLLPQVEDRVKLNNGKFVNIRGLDAFALLQSTSGHSSFTRDRDEQNSISLLGFSYPPYELLVSTTLAQIHQLKNGDTVTLTDGQTLPPIRIVSDEVGTGYSLVCDLTCAQKVLSFENELTSIALTQKPSSLDLLKASLPKHARLVLPGKNAQNKALNDAFFLNMTAVSLLAFLVGCFIAFNAVRFSVLQRFSLVQQLRVTGVTFKEVAWALLLELILWATLASIIGSILGWLIADTLLPSVGLTITQLFQGKNLLALPDIQQWWYLALAISLGATILAVAQPFWQLATRRPMQQKGADSNQTTLGLFGLLALLFGYGLTWLEHSQLLGFAVTFCWFIGGALLVPDIVVRLYGILSRTAWVQANPKLQWLVADGRFNHARLSIAMMAFSVAIAAGIGISTMVSSFQLALEDYLDQVLAEDLYLQPNHRKSTQIYQYLEQHPDVKLAYRFYHTKTNMTKMTKGQQPFSSFVRGLSHHSIRQQSISLERQTTQVWQKLNNRSGIVINQTLAFQQQLDVGDMLEIQLKDKSVRVSVLGIYHSYGATISSFIIDQNWLISLWPDVTTSEIGLFLKPDKNIDALIEQLKTRFDVKSHQAIKPQTIKALALKIFAQTFEATKLLSIFTLLIAAVGIYCACYAAQVDQQKQLSLLKILGLEQHEITKLCSIQLLFNSTVAALVAIPLGLLIAWACVHIVLQYSFGWYFDIVVNTMTIASIVTTAIVIALFSGVIPLYRLGRKPVLTAFGEGA